MIDFLCSYVVGGLFSPCRFSGSFFFFFSLYILFVFDWPAGGLVGKRWMDLGGCFFGCFVSFFFPR